MKNEKRLTLEQLLDRKQTDTLGPFLGGFAAMTVQGVCISGGVISNMGKYIETDDAELTGQTGLEIEFSIFAHVRSAQTLKQEKTSPTKERFIRGLEIFLHHNCILIVYDATGAEVVIYPSAKSVLDEAKGAFTTAPT